jgi:hypothetical protein
MSYRVQLTAVAIKERKRLAQVARERVDRALKSLSVNKSRSMKKQDPPAFPRPDGSLAPRGWEFTHRQVHSTTLRVHGALCLIDPT